MRSSFLALFVSAGLSVVLPISSWAQPEEPEKKQDVAKKADKPQPSARKSWYSDCPGCASTLGGGGRAGPFSTIEECREKVAKLVAQGYPYGFCRSDQ
jgi:hypothetical protein